MAAIATQLCKKFRQPAPTSRAVVIDDRCTADQQREHASNDVARLQVDDHVDCDGVEMRSEDQKRNSRAAPLEENPPIEAASMTLLRAAISSTSQYADRHVQGVAQDRLVAIHSHGTQFSERAGLEGVVEAECEGGASAMGRRFTIVMTKAPG